MFAGFSSFPAQLGRSLAAAAGLAVELAFAANTVFVLAVVGMDMAAGTVAVEIAAASSVLAAGKLVAAGMAELAEAAG